VASVFRGNGALYALLLILVWGMTAPWRGLWQDDSLLLRLAFVQRAEGLSRTFEPVIAPLRRLYTLPFHLVLLTPWPILTLQAMHGALWLGQALLAGWISSLALPGRRLTRLTVVALTLTATSDYLTNNLTALGYNVAVFALLVALGCGLRYIQRGGAPWAFSSAAALAWSLLTVEVSIPALPAMILLFIWSSRRNWSESWYRLASLALLWGITLAPLLAVEWRFLHDPKSYARVAILPLSPWTVVGRALRDWGDNFTPWHWVFGRPSWYTRPPTVISPPTMALGAALGALGFTWRAWRTPREEEPRALPEVVLALLFAAMALASNWAYAGLQMAEIHYRTHILSRVWASLAIGILAGWLAARGPLGRRVALAVGALFVGFGTWGGLERQDLFLSTWHQHRRELASIVTAAPELRAGSGIILRRGRTAGSYLATEAEYLAESWIVLLYSRTDIHFLLLVPERGTGCRSTPGGLDCWHEGQGESVARGTCAPDRFAFGKLVVLDYDAGRGEYHVCDSLVGDPLGSEAGTTASDYRPAARIVQREVWNPERRALLDWWPEADPWVRP
jgi:hypothetical protein